MAFGILPYDTTDNSVVFRCPLTTLASATDIGITDISTGNNVFDPVKGISPKVNGSGISGLRLRLSVMTLESGAGDNLPQGQISFEVERKALAIPASVADSESNGFENGADQVPVMTWGADGEAVANHGVFSKRQLSNSYDILLKAGKTGGTAGSKWIASNALTDQWAMITISWQCNKTQVYLDGFPLNVQNRSNDNPLTQWADIYLGSYGGVNTVPNWNNEYYIRNLIMSSKPVSLNYHPYLAHIMHVGDSFAGGQFLTTTDIRGELNENNVIGGRLNKLGFGFQTFTVNSNGGGTVTNAGADQLKLDVDGVGTTRAQAAATKPTFIIFEGGVNDRTTYTASFLPDLKEHVQEYMADGVTYTVNNAAKRMILIAQCTDAVLTTDMQAIQADIRSIPAWWDAAYPSRAGHVQVVDMVPLFTNDGITVNADYQKVDRVHPNSLGDYLTGNAVADKMLTMLG